MWLVSFWLWVRSFHARFPALGPRASLGQVLFPFLSMGLGSWVLGPGPIIHHGGMNQMNNPQPKLHDDNHPVRRHSIGPSIVVALLVVVCPNA